MQVDVEVNQPVEVEGFPIPPLQDLLGDEIPLDQLISLGGEENPNDNNMVNEEEVQDVQIDQLVGPGEDGFPDFNLGGGM